MMMSHLKKQIRQKEQRIEAKKKLIHQNYQQLKNSIQDKMKSPEVLVPALLTAFSFGFLITYYSPHKKFSMPQLTEHFLTAKNLFLLLA